MNEPELVAAIIAATDEKKIVGRIRLQKIIYFLNELGSLRGSEFDFSYHHYGPYSRKLEHAILDAKDLGLIKEERMARRSDGASYSVFSMEGTQNLPSLNKSDPDRIQALAKANVTVLELAATAHWLSQIEKVCDWQNELKKRKGQKAENRRLEKALRLLKELNLPPGENRV